MKNMLRTPRRRRWPRVLWALLLALGVAFLISMATARLPEAALPARVAAPEVITPGLSVCWVEYASGETLGLAASAGWPDALRWVTTTSGLLVRHPRGEVLIDMGTSRRTAEEAESLPLTARSLIRLNAMSEGFHAPLPEALERVGLSDPRGLRWLLPTHGHFDHLGGLMELPSVPVLISQEELAFVRSERAQRRLVFDEHVKALEGRLEELRFEERPYEFFARSADLFGDGSVVVVPLPGHTPGHLGVIINVAADLRLFYLGDAVSAEVGLKQRTPKSLILAYSDEDDEAAGKTAALLSAVSALRPTTGLTMLPGHDRAPWVRVFGPEPGCIGAPAAAPASESAPPAPDGGVPAEPASAP